MVCDCFNQLASIAMAGMLFVSEPMWVDLELDMWAYLRIFLFLRERDSNVEVVSLLEWQAYILILNSLSSLFNRSWRS